MWRWSECLPVNLNGTLSITLSDFVRHSPNILLPKHSQVFIFTQLQARSLGNQHHSLWTSINSFYPPFVPAHAILAYTAATGSQAAWQSNGVTPEHSEDQGLHSGAVLVLKARSIKVTTLRIKRQQQPCTHVAKSLGCAIPDSLYF